MAPKKSSVTQENLAALGPERLATLLIDLAAGDAEVKRRLRLELAAQAGGDTIAALISKRISSLRSARSFVDWQKRRDFVKELDLQRAMIVDRVAPTRADLALDLMWRFMDLAGPVLNRVDDSNGSVGAVFHAGCADLRTIAVKARPDPADLANRVFTALQANEHGAYDGLVSVMLPALGDAGATHLKQRLTEALVGQPKQASGRNWCADAIRGALQDIADGQADVDSYIALVPIEQRTRPGIGVQIGRRLLAAGRAAEALDALEKARPEPRASQARDYDDDLYLAGYGGGTAWDDVYIDALEATGQTEKAQRLRWAAFEERLAFAPLRAYLKRLSGFEDVEAEERAMTHVLGFRNFSVALDFLREWPDQARAGQLVLRRASEIDGNLYYLLDQTAQLIEGRHPLAATLLRRAMIEDTLAGAKATRYKHAARHLLQCASLAPSIKEFGTFEPHETFINRLRTSHSRKTGFWAQMTQTSEGRY